MACRDLFKAEIARKEVIEKSGSTNIFIEELDLASLESVRNFVERSIFFKQLF